MDQTVARDLAARMAHGGNQMTGFGLIAEDPP